MTSDVLLYLWLSGVLLGLSIAGLIARAVYRNGVADGYNQGRLDAAKGTRCEVVIKGEQCGLLADHEGVHKWRNGD